MCAYSVSRNFQLILWREGDGAVKRKYFTKAAGFLLKISIGMLICAVLYLCVYGMALIGISADCYRNVFSEKWRYSYRVGKSNFCLVERKGTRSETGGVFCQSDRRNIFLKIWKSIVNMLLFDDVISSEK